MAKQRIWNLVDKSKGDIIEILIGISLKWKTGGGVHIVSDNILTYA